MVKEKIINFFVLIVIFLLTLSLLRIFYIYYQQKIYVSAEGSGSYCPYLKWQGNLPNEGGIIPQSTLNSNEVIPSPIKVNNGGVIISPLSGSSPDPMLRVIGTSSLDVVSSSKICLAGVCYSDWPSGGSGSDYWLLLNGGSRFYLRPSSTDWWVSIGSTTPPTTTLHVFGNVMADNFLGKISAVNISSGVFGFSVNGGNFGFPASLSVNTSSLVLPSIFGGGGGLNVEGTIRASSRLCIGNTCYSNWPSISSIAVKIPFYNGLLYPPTTSWQSVYPVTSQDLVRRPPDKYPYISFIDVINKLNPPSSATATDWFDLFYGFHHISEPGYDKALYAEESDNSYPLSWYATSVATMTCGNNVVFKRNSCNDWFGGATFYDAQGVLRATSNEKFLIDNCFNGFQNDGCSGMGPSLINLFATSSQVKGKVLLELRVVPWQRPTTSYVCSNREYIPRMRLQSWNHPNDIFLKITKYKNVTSTDTCAGALTRAKIQGRFVADIVKANEGDIQPSPLQAIKEYLSSEGKDFIFVFKEVGLSVLSWVSNQ